MSNTPTETLVRDLEVGDVIHRDEFNEAHSHVTITKISPYGTSHHSLIITGKFVAKISNWSGGDWDDAGSDWDDEIVSKKTESYVFDTLTKIRTLNPETNE